MSNFYTQSDSLKRYLLLLCLIGIPILFLVLFGSLVARAHHPPKSEMPTARASRYESPQLMNRPTTIDLWVELGRDKEVLTRVIDQQGYRVELLNMVVGDHWQVPESSDPHVRWHMRAGKQAEIRIQPLDASSQRLRQAKAIALYLTDDSWGYRSARIQSGQIDMLVDSMSPGRWVLLPVAKIDPDFNDIRISIQPILGYGTLVSAVAVLREKN